MKKYALVVGARPYSLGEAVVSRLQGEGWTVRTAGLHHEDYRLDIHDEAKCNGMLQSHAKEHGAIPHAVICTAGVNDALPFDAKLKNGLWGDILDNSLSVNATGPLTLLRAYARVAENVQSMEETLGGSPGPRHFVAISSNSANIARTRSVAYCASKAALTMGVRVAAREYAPDRCLSAYVYEPGWIEGTAMSMDVTERLGKDAAPHRIPAGQGIGIDSFSRMIVNNLDTGMDLNGCALRVDGGEQ